MARSRWTAPCHHAVDRGGEGRVLALQLGHVDGGHGLGDPGLGHVDILGLEGHGLGPGVGHAQHRLGVAHLAGCRRHLGIGGHLGGLRRVELLLAGAAALIGFENDGADIVGTHALLLE